ncbi:MAG: UDP-3-O-(3-hydroxymyristoyl)glucosamine N-acyltransferase [Woeseiaceae bacterium]
MAISVGELATQFGCELIGDPSIRVSGVATLSRADDTQLAFLANPAYRAELRTTRAGAVILRPDDAPHCPVAALLASDPYLLFARMATALHPAPAFPAGIHPSAVIADSAEVADDAHVAAHVVIGGHSRIGRGAAIGAGSVIGERCTVGDHTRLHANVTLVQNVAAGKRCIFHSGAVIGADGFGNARGAEGWVKVPQLGGVRIGDDVEIGANTTIDRGAIEDTVIENGVRIDNLVQIAHNVRVGEHTAMAAMTGISGSTVIGKRCMFGGQAGLVGHIRICDDVIITGRTLVTKNIDRPGVYSSGFPAEDERTWKRRVARFRRLDRRGNGRSGSEQ